MAISTNDRSQVLDPTNSLSDCRAFGAGFRAHRGAGGVGDAAQGILHAVARADCGVHASATSTCGKHGQDLQTRPPVKMLRTTHGTSKGLQLLGPTEGMMLPI